MVTLEGWIARPHGVQRGSLVLGDRIERVAFEGRVIPAPEDDAPRYLPGFIDVHVHGGGGGDAMDGADGVRTLARHHLRHGTTTLLPTTVTQRWDDVLAALEGIAKVRREATADADPALPDLPGAHLEGPFVSPDRLGAQPPHATPPTPERVRRAIATGVLRVVTLAPELDGAPGAARAFAEAGVRVSVGHTRADANAVAALADAVREAGGTLGFTHLFNAMGGLEGRAPGVVGACFADAEAFAELILDGHHVDPVAFLAARAAKPGRLMLITDAMRASGAGDGRSELGGQTVTVTAGAARLDDGTLAGSVLTLDAALRRAVDAGLGLAEVAALLADVPAAYLGLGDRGRIEAGLRADVVELDRDLNVTRVYAAGREVQATDATTNGGAT